MFKERLLSGIVLVILAIGAIYSGGVLLLLAVGLLSLIGQYELYRVLKLEKCTLGYAGYLATIAYEITLYMCKAVNMEIFLLAFLLVCMSLYVIGYPKYEFKQVAMTVTGFFYVTVCLSCLYQVRMMENGVWLVWIIFIAAWGSDTCAYCVGKLAGKHKLPSPLSPKKTIEGCAGGVLGAALIAFIYANVCKKNLIIGANPVLIFTLLGGLGGVCSQIGDLAASAIKRNYDIKDYGKLIPGHGGVMDRFDSILFTAPLSYILFSVI